jgi:tRNA(Ile)-lysidine synthetase-like protein
VRRSLDSLVDFNAQRCTAIAGAIARGEGGLFPASRDTHVELSAGRLSFHHGAARRAESAAADGAPAESTIIVPRGGAIARDTLGRVSMRRTTTAAHRRRAPKTFIDAAALPPGTTLIVRTPRVGDKCIPSGRHRAVPLRKFLAKSGVPNHRRDRVLLLCYGPHIVAALGVRVMEPYGPRGDELIAVDVMKSAPG